MVASKVKTNMVGAGLVHYFRADWMLSFVGDESGGEMWHAMQEELWMNVDKWSLGDIIIQKMEIQ